MVGLRNSLFDVDVNIQEGINIQCPSLLTYVRICFLISAFYFTVCLSVCLSLRVTLCISTAQGLPLSRCVNLTCRHLIEILRRGSCSCAGNKNKKNRHMPMPRMGLGLMTPASEWQMTVHPNYQEIQLQSLKSINIQSVSFQNCCHKSATDRVQLRLKSHTVVFVNSFGACGSVINMPGRKSVFFK